MASSKENGTSEKYYYYDYHNGNIAREKAGSSWSDGYRFEFYRDGVWTEGEPMSLSLSDAIMCYGGYSVFDYEELTEEEAMRRIAAMDKK